MTATEYLIHVLGGSKVFRGRELPTSAQMRDRINDGLPFSSLESVRERLHLSVPEAAAVLQMPARTFARRRSSRKLAADESDRLYRLARIAAQAFGVFGTEEKASAWLRRPNRALNHELPLRLLDTDLGSRQIEDLLGRIAHGVVS
jgi:putative toxin-antitoxin system antitoxin component (TIGR02293 family)